MTDEQISQLLSNQREQLVATLKAVVLLAEIRDLLASDDDDDEPEGEL